MLYLYFENDPHLICFYFFRYIFAIIVDLFFFQSLQLLFTAIFASKRKLLWQIFLYEMTICMHKLIVLDHFDAFISFRKALGRKFLCCRHILAFFFDVILSHFFCVSYLNEGLLQHITSAPTHMLYQFHMCILV